MKILWRRLVGHFENYRTLDRWPFFWRVTLEGLAVPWALNQLIGLLVHWPPLPSLHDLNVGKYFFLAVLAGPLWELVLWQWLPIMVARRFQVSFWGQVFISWFIFFLPHLGNGLRGAIGGGLLGGFYCVFTCVTWRERASLWAAGYMTYLSHALHNLIVLSIWWFAVP